MEDIIYHFNSDNWVSYTDLRYQVVETNVEFDSEWIIASSNYKHIAEKCKDEYNTKRKFGVKYEVVDSQA